MAKNPFTQPTPSQPFGVPSPTPVAPSYTPSSPPNPSGPNGPTFPGAPATPAGLPQSG